VDAVIMPRFLFRATRTRHSRLTESVPRPDAVLSTFCLKTIKILKCLIGRLKKLLIGWKSVTQLGCSTKELRQDLTLVGLGQGLEGFQKMPRCVSHGEIF